VSGLPTARGRPDDPGFSYSYSSRRCWVVYA